MYLKHFHLNQHPFSEEPDLRIFFPEAGRLDTLRALLKDIEEGQPLMKLSGREGTGKTLLCLLMADQLPDDFQIVCLDHPVGSFENLLRIICLNLGEDSIDGTPSSDILELFRGQLTRQKKDQRKVVLIIDEAEQLFLATLERLLRMICDMEEADMVQIVLIGRPDFDPYLDQLAMYCSNVDVHAAYLLEPLSLEETGRYLHFRLLAAGFSGTEHDTIFTDDAVLEIYRAAMGNLQLTNMIARNAMEKACSDEMTHVLPGHVNPRLDADRSVRHKGTLPPGFVTRKKIWMGAGAAALLLALLIAFWPKGERDETPLVMHEEHAATLPARQVEEPASRPDVETSDRLVHLIQDGKKQKPGGKVGTSVVQTESKKKSDTAESMPAARTEKPPPRDGNQLLNERMRATSTWLARAYRGGFTIQLMMLRSDQAISNLKSMLIQDDYYRVKDELYILNKTSPPGVYVFYGMYDSMKEARDVRNKMPAFLRRHQPYALSINDALKKIGG